MIARSAAVEYASLLRHRGWRVLGAIALAAVLGIAAFGGFRKASSSTSAQVGAGKVLDAGALRITPLRAWVARSQPGRDARPGDDARYLVLRLDVENRTDSSTQASSYLDADVRWLSGATPAVAARDDDAGNSGSRSGRGIRDTAADGTTARTALRADDHSLYVALPPRLPSTVDLVWPLPAGSPIPTQAQWRVAKRNRVEQTYLTREGGWLPKGQAGTLQLAIEDRLAAGAPP